MWDLGAGVMIHVWRFESCQNVKRRNAGHSVGCRVDKRSGNVDVVERRRKEWRNRFGWELRRKNGDGKGWIGAVVTKARYEWNGGLLVRWRERRKLVHKRAVSMVGRGWVAWVAARGAVDEIARGW